jgi:hypothetical protein
MYLEIWKTILDSEAKKLELENGKEEVSMQGTKEEDEVDIYLILRSISSFNNPQNSEMKICENMKFTC